jgi:hypothetical protein
MKLIEIYDGTIFHAQMVKDLLEIEGIESSLKDEIIGTRGDSIWRPAGGVKVIISDLDYDKAKKIIDEFEKSQSEN